MVLLASALAVYAGAALLAIVLPRPALSAVYPLCLVAALAACAADIGCARWQRCLQGYAPAGAAHGRPPLPARLALRVFRPHRQSGHRGLQPLRVRHRPRRSVEADRALLSGLLRGHEPCSSGGRRLRLPVLLGTHVLEFLGAGGFAPRGRGLPQGRLCLSHHGGHGHDGAALCFWRDGGGGRRLWFRFHPRAHAHAAGVGSGAGRRAVRHWIEGRASCRCTPGCRSPTPPRQAMSPRS